MDPAPRKFATLSDKGFYLIVVQTDKQTGVYFIDVLLFK